MNETDQIDSPISFCLAKVEDNTQFPEASTFWIFDEQYHGDFGLITVASEITESFSMAFDVEIIMKTLIRT